MLTEILKDKYKEVAQLKKTYRGLNLNSLAKSKNSFKKSLSKYKYNYIFEIKQSSPSKGLLKKKLNINDIVECYNCYASAISVLTAKKFFNGSYENLELVRNLSQLPILQKDFIVDPWQILLGRYFGANAVLLMLSVLDNKQYEELKAVANRLNMDVLTEVHTQDEALRALELNADIVGINNRNLLNLKIDLKTTAKLSKIFSKKQILISESGIESKANINSLKAYTQRFLIGSAVMSSQNTNAAVKEIVFGKNKVCGLTRINDALAAEKAGAYYGGFIFYKESPRYIDPKAAMLIKQKSNLEFVAVFVDEKISRVVAIVKSLKLKVVQLHGNESNEYIDELRLKLPAIEIWKAINIKNKLPKIDCNADCILLDLDKELKIMGQKSFDWQLLKSLKWDKDIMLAGGIDINSIEKALQFGFKGLDLNSGLEIKPGIKSKLKINQAFKAIRDF